MSCADSAADARPVNEIIKIESPQQCQALLERTSNSQDHGLVVLYFSAIWCPPCKMVSSKFSKLVKDFPQVAFGKIDIDEQEGLMRQHNVRTVPNFKVFRQGIEVGHVVGAHLNQVASLLRKLLAPEGARERSVFEEDEV